MTTVTRPDHTMAAAVGTFRRPSTHVGRAVTAEQTVHVLHSAACWNSPRPSHRCRFARALANGIDLDAWAGHFDTPVALAIVDGRLTPEPLTPRNTTEK